MFLLLACASPAALSAQDNLVLHAPQFTDVSVSCDADAAKWHFTADTDAWTGNGQVILSADGNYVEAHGLRSKAADAQGAWDQLSLDLSIMADWRNASPGSSTAFNCLTPGLSGILRVFEVDGSTEADCRAFGETSWSRWNTGYSCDIPLEEPS